MTTRQRFTRLIAAALMLASLGACTIVPAYPSYVETYPAYTYHSPNVSLYYVPPRYGHHHHGGYRR